MPRPKIDPETFDDRGKRLWASLNRLFEKHPGTRESFLDRGDVSIGKWARACGSSPSTLSRLLRGDRGTRVDPETVFNVAHLHEEEAEFLWLGRGPRIKRSCLDEAITSLMEPGVELLTEIVAQKARTMPELYELPVGEARQALRKMQEEENRTQSLALHERQERERATAAASKKLRAAERERKRSAKREAAPQPTAAVAPASSRAKKQRTGT